MRSSPTYLRTVILLLTIWFILLLDSIHLCDALLFHCVNGHLFEGHIGGGCRSLSPLQCGSTWWLLLSTPIIMLLKIFLLLFIFSLFFVGGCLKPWHSVIIDDHYKLCVNALTCHKQNENSNSCLRSHFINSSDAARFDTLWLASLICTIVSYCVLEPMPYLSAFLPMFLKKWLGHE